MRCRCRAPCCHPWPCRCTRSRPTVILPSTVLPGQQWHFIGVEQVSLPALHWHYWQLQAVLVAGVAPSLLPSCPSRSGRCRASICRRCTCILPASCCRHCQHRAFVHVTGILPASLPCCGVPLPLLCRHLCPHRLCLASSIATLHLPSHETVTTHTGVIASRTEQLRKLGRLLLLPRPV